jgi:hypothetical protein
MNKKTVSFPTIFIGLAILFVMLGCNIGTTRVGSSRTDSQSIELGSASTAKVEVNFGAGELNLGGGAASLMDGTFTYNVAKWKPGVDYNVSGQEGKLTISNESEEFPVGGEVVNKWDLQFNNDVPIDMLIQTGAGENVIDLSALEITAVTVGTGAGNTTLDLTGSWNHDVSVSVTGGLGDITINLPAGMGVKVNADTALVNVNTSGLSKTNNTYTNDAFGTASYTLTLDLQVGVGSVNLVVAE